MTAGLEHEEFWRLFAVWWNHLDSGWQYAICVLFVVVVFRLVHDNDRDVRALKRRCDNLQREVDALKRKADGQ